MQESQGRCNHLANDNQKLIEQLRLQREELQAEKLTNTQVEKLPLFFFVFINLCFFKLLEQLKFESSRQKFSRSYSQTENILKTSETHIQDLDAQIQALKLVKFLVSKTNKEQKIFLISLGKCTIKTRK